jgi:hypothetical protein
MVDAQVQEANLIRLLAAARRKDARDLAETTKGISPFYIYVPPPRPPSVPLVLLR